MMKIPFYDLQKEHESMFGKYKDIFSNVLIDSNFILGKSVKKFEDEWAKYIDVPHAVGVGTGTDALILSLKALDIKEGDEVIVPAFTFVATAFAVTVVGAKPVFVDVDKRTHAIDVSKIERNINKRTRAILPVHLYGNVADMDSIMSIAKDYKLYVVEDAAQAHGATYRQKKAGAIGDMACFSFYPSKNLGALGDGGIIVTKKKSIATKLTLLRNYGQRKKYYSDILGTNSRLDELQAAILLEKLKNLDSLNKKRHRIVNYYRNRLKDLKIATPIDTENSTSAHHLFTIQIKKRNAIMDAISKRGVATLIHYPVPLHLQKVYRGLGYKKGDFPIAESIASQTISLPLFPTMEISQAEYVMDMLEKVL